jgi:hypothetical protein
LTCSDKPTHFKLLRTIKNMKKHVWLALVILTVAGRLVANSTTSAFEARGIANKQLNEKVRDKVIQIFGAQSGVGLYPVSWKILFWDATAAQNGRSVTVKDGAISEIKDGYTQLEQMRLAAYKQEEVIDIKLLKWDSSSALDKVMKMPVLKEVKLSSVEFLLTKGDGAVQPIWNLKLFADNAGEKVEIGQVRMSAESGEVFEIKLQLEKLKKS